MSKDYWDSVSDNDKPENRFANPDLIAVPDFVEEFANRDLLYHALKNLAPRQKDLLIDHFGLFGRRPKSLRHIARDRNVSQNAVYKGYKVAIARLRHDFKRLENGGHVKESI